MENCTCLPQFHSSYKYAGTINLPTCQGRQLACANDWLNKMASKEMSSAEDTNNQTRPCLHSCNYQTDMVTITSASYPNYPIFPLRKDLCITLQKLASLCSRPYHATVVETQLKNKKVKYEDILFANNSGNICNEDDYLNESLAANNSDLIDYLYSYTKANMAVVTVFIQDPYYTSILRDESISFVTFLGNAGGLFGIFLGVSLVSMFEILYYFADYIHSKAYRVMCRGNLEKK
jgi:hypothetical protein